MGGGGSGDDEEELEVALAACKQARDTLDQQILKLHNSDKKAMALFRGNILLLGVLATGFSIAVRTEDFPLGQFVNIHLKTGLILIIFSTSLAAMGYTSSSIRMGVGPKFIADLHQSENSKIDFYNELHQKYINWLEKNEKANEINSTLITFSIMAAINGIVFVIGAIGVWIDGTSGSATENNFLIVLLVLCLILDFFIRFSNNIFSALYSNSD